MHKPLLALNTNKADTGLLHIGIGSWCASDFHPSDLLLTMWQMAIAEQAFSFVWNGVHIDYENVYLFYT